MPVQTTYPGVYIEEIPSAVRTITGVATSITAFIGRAQKGPVNDPVTINSFSDYERLFGGLWSQSMMSYAVKDFYLNGGSTAIIVRIITDSGDSSTLDLPSEGSPPGDLTLEASSPGEWGDSLHVTVKHLTASSGLDNWESLFNLYIWEEVDGTQVILESFLNVTLLDDHPRYLSRVLAEQSSLLRVTGTVPTGPRVLETDPSSPDTFLGLGIKATDGDGGDVLGEADYLGSPSEKSGMYALKKADIFNLLCIPPASRDEDTSDAVYAAALQLCVDERAMLLVDPPYAWGANESQATANAIAGLPVDIGLSGKATRNAAIFFPRILAADPLLDNQTQTFVPCGIIAGIMSRTDTNRGVWKSPAGIDATLNGIRGLQAKLNDDENGQLNPLGINCLRSFPVFGRVVWGARTLRGADQLADEYKYIAVRRTALFIEESLYRGTQWVVFEPNDEPLWAQIRLNVGAFMHNLFRQGAFQGTTPRDAYLVKCDSETTTQNDINQGKVNILVGFAPLKPAEFVIIKIQQLTGQIQS